MRRRVVTPEEMQLWQSVTQHDEKFDNGRFVDAQAPVARIRVHTPRAQMPEFSDAMMYAPLMLGGYAGIDRNTADRFRKGELALDGTVDLHGMSREKAHRAISGFVHAHYMCGSRCLLAITGKGKNDEIGVLRGLLPQWLEEPGLRPLVLACDVAKPKHGGTGAYYILLRRKR